MSAQVQACVFTLCSLIAALVLFVLTSIPQNSFFTFVSKWALSNLAFSGLGLAGACLKEPKSLRIFFFYALLDHLLVSLVFMIFIASSLGSSTSLSSELCDFVTETEALPTREWVGGTINLDKFDSLFDWLVDMCDGSILQRGLLVLGIGCGSIVIRTCGLIVTWSYVGAIEGWNSKKHTMGLEGECGSYDQREKRDLLRRNPKSLKPFSTGSLKRSSRARAYTQWSWRGSSFTQRQTLPFEPISARPRSQSASAVRPTLSLITQYPDFSGNLPGPRSAMATLSGYTLPLSISSKGHRHNSVLPLSPTKSERRSSAESEGSPEQSCIPSSPSSTSSTGSGSGLLTGHGRPKSRSVKGRRPSILPD